MKKKELNLTREQNNALYTHIKDNNRYLFYGSYMALKAFLWDNKIKYTKAQMNFILMKGLNGTLV